MCMMPMFYPKKSLTHPPNLRRHSRKTSENTLEIPTFMRHPTFGKLLCENHLFCKKPEGAQGKYIP